MKKIVYLILLLSVNIFPQNNYQGNNTQNNYQDNNTQNINLDELVKETQLMPNMKNPDDMTLFWWIPNEFWIGSFEMDPTITKEQMDEFINIVKPYTVLVVIDGRMNLIGSFSYKSKDEISKKIKIFDSYNNTYYPLKDNEISTDAKDFIELMKPFFSNMLGPFGQNLQFFLFPSENKYKSKMIDVKSNGFFKFEYNNIEYKYRLPLGSLMPQKTCHKCYENFTGNYLYCPWDGNLLK